MSEKPIGQKLYLKEDQKFLVVNEPEGYRLLLGSLPKNIHIVTDSAEPFDVIQVFVNDRKGLEAQLTRLKPVLRKNGIFWVIYPKGTSKIKTDINRDSIREFADTIGLQ